MTGNVDTPRCSVRHGIVLLFLLLVGYFILLRVTTGINYNASYGGGGYTENWIALHRVPLVVTQVSSKLWGILFVFKLALLSIVIGRCGQRKWRWILFAWLAAEVLQMLVVRGARTGLVLFLVAAALLYHRMIRPLSLKTLLVLGSCLLVFFTFLGLYRAYTDLATWQKVVSKNNSGLFRGGSEFQALLGTEYHVLRLKKTGVELPWYLYINDFGNILPPQQFLPFQKVSASEWYLRQIGLDGTGVGYMWGVISQSIVGLDWIELVVRGGVLGFVLGKLHRWYMRHQSGFFETLFYVYVCVNVYWTFRDTTCSILSKVVWEFIPFYVLLACGSAVITALAWQKSYLRVQPLIDSSH